MNTGDGGERAGGRAEDTFAPGAADSGSGRGMSRTVVSSIFRGYLLSDLFERGSLTIYYVENETGRAFP